MGFKVEQFVSKVDENLICGICLEVLEDPWQCKDGHIFCKDCITQCLEQKQICPMDNNALQLDGLGRCLAVKNIVESLGVYCQPPERDGQVTAKIDAEESKRECEWTGKLQSLAKHRETCPFQQVKCPNKGCNINMQRRELDDHDMICKHKKVECQKCRDVLVRGEMEIHKDQYCPEELIPCPNSCRSPESRQIKRINLNDHLKNECAKKIVDCPFKDQGCSVQVERQHVGKHVQDNMAAHMMLLAKQCSLLTKQNLSLAEQNTTLTEECSTLKQTVLMLKSTNTKQNTTFSEQCSALTKQSSALTKENSSLSEQCSDLTQKYSSLSEQCSDLTQKYSSLSEQCSALTKENLSLSEQCSTLAMGKSSLSEQCSTLTEQYSELTKKCSSLTEQYSELKNECLSLTKQNTALTEQSLQQLEKKCSGLKDELNQVKKINDECSRTYTWHIKAFEDYCSFENYDYFEDPEATEDETFDYHEDFLTNPCVVTTEYPDFCSKLVKLKSPTFWLCGYNWYLLLYPNGDNQENRRFVSVYLYKGSDNYSFSNQFDNNYCYGMVGNWRGNGNPPIQEVQMPSSKISVTCRLSMISQKTGIPDISSEITKVSSDISTAEGCIIKWPRFTRVKDAYSGAYFVQTKVEPAKTGWSLMEENEAYYEQEHFYGLGANSSLSDPGTITKGGVTIQCTIQLDKPQ